MYLGGSNRCGGYGEEDGCWERGVKGGNWMGRRWIVEVDG